MLESVTLPASVTTISAYAFGDCASLTSLSVPDSVTELADSAFDDCDALVICCSTDSYARQYAESNGISYVLSEECILLGDADGDGFVTILDATCIQRRLADLPVESFVETAADVDGDGLSIIDATLIQRYLAGFENIHHIDEPLIVSDPTAPGSMQDPYELPSV